MICQRVLSYKKTLSIKLFQILNLTLRVVLGGIFVFAGTQKFISPIEFAEAIANFKILNEVVINVFALGLPLCEVTLGIMLIFPRVSVARKGALGLFILNGIFIILLSQAWVRGLSLNCGCFGVNTMLPDKWSVPGSIFRDLILLGIAAHLHCVIRTPMIIERLSDTDSL